MRGVNRILRDVPLLPPIDQTRRELYMPFLEAIDSPGMKQAKKWTTQHLQPFDGEAYVSSLRQRFDFVPKEFLLWILEWPAKVAIANIWPGLPRAHKPEWGISPRRVGFNTLATFPPQLYRLYLYTEPNERVYTVPMLPVWIQDQDVSATYMIMDTRPHLQGLMFYVQDAQDMVRPDGAAFPDPLTGKGMST